MRNAYFTWEGGSRRLVFRPARVALTALAAAFLGACAASNPHVDSTTILDAQRAESTFATGYRQIANRYIEPVAIDALAVEGLNGLDAIDPKIDFKRSGRRVRLLYDGAVLRVADAAASDDADGWATLTFDALAEARNVSETIRRIPAGRLYEAVFDGMLSKLDSFSRYASAAEALDNRAKRSGFNGIGIRFRVGSDGPRITEVFARTPAARAGLRVGDLITHVDRQPLAGRSRKEIRNMLRGEAGTSVLLRYVDSRTNRPNFRSLERSRVIPPTVRTKVHHNILHITISGFNDRTSGHLSRAVKAAMARPDAQLHGVLLDLRNNPGGLLIQAVKVADLFLKSGRIVSTRGRHPNSVRDYDAHGTDITDGLPMVVLINGRSASAAEIVAAALQDHERAVVIGTGSFGKGTVQTITRLPNNGEITLTWSRFVAPSGYSLHDLGVSPSVCTSGPDSGVSGLVGSALSHMAETYEHMARWRSVPVADTSNREALRRVCPAAHERRNIEVRLGEYLLDHPDQHRQLLAVAPTMAASRGK